MRPNKLTLAGLIVTRIANTSTLGGDRRAPGPCPRDIICQTRTRNAAGADATATPFQYLFLVYCSVEKLMH